MFFGGGAARSPLGTSFDTGESLARFGVIIVYVCVQLSYVATLAFLLSTLVDNPLGAVGGAVMLTVVMTILDSITALGSFRHYLPSHWDYAWTDVLTSPINWDNMLRGAGVSLCYAAVFLAIAWLRFDRKDITS